MAPTVLEVIYTARVGVGHLYGGSVHCIATMAHTTAMATLYMLAVRAIAVVEVCGVHAGMGVAVVTLLRSVP